MYKGGILKKLNFLIIFLTFTTLLLIGCTKSQNEMVINPFNDISMDSVKKIEFRNFDVSSNKNEIGRSKIVIDESDIEKLGEYLKSIKATESNEKAKEAVLSIGLIDNTEKDKHFISSIIFCKNQIIIYKYNKENNNETVESVYKNTDSEIIKELSDMYNDMNYKEEFLYKK